MLVGAIFAMNAVAQHLTDAQIAAAIKAGESKQFSHLVSECRAQPGFGESLAGGLVGGIQTTGYYDITLSADEGRIAIMAAQAKRLYKPFVLTDVTEDLLKPAVVVSVEPGKPSSVKGGWEVPALIEHVVLKSKAKSAEAIQPLRVEKEPVEWSSTLGAKAEGNRAVAFFEFDAVRELPPGDFDMVVITPSGERRCKVGVKDRDRLFPSRR